jgi:hypothetical protein
VNCTIFFYKKNSTILKKISGIAWWNRTIRKDDIYRIATSKTIMKNMFFLLNIF